MEEKKRDLPFLITISYLLSFLFIRLVVFIAGAARSRFAQAAEMGSAPEVKFSIGRNIILFGYHIHHFYFGIFLIAVAAWLAIVGSSKFTKKHIAVIYGAGLGLFMDEIGLLLTWGDYFSGLSYLLSIFLIGVFLNVVFFPHFWEEVRQNLGDPGSRSLILGILSRRNRLVRIIDKISEKTGMTERTSLFFAGTVSLLICVLILSFPKFLRYWIFALFMVEGLNHLVRAWEK